MPFALPIRSEEHTSELQSHSHLVCRLLLEKKNNTSVFTAMAPITCLLLVCDDTSAAPVFTDIAHSDGLVAAGVHPSPVALFVFFFKDTATTEIYPLPLHDPLPIYHRRQPRHRVPDRGPPARTARPRRERRDRSEEHTSELQSHSHLVCRLLLE